MNPIVQVFFMHPRYGTTFSVSLDPALSGREVIAHLLRTGFIPARAEGYQIGYYEQLLSNEQVFASLPTLQDGDVLRVLERSLSGAPEMPIFVYIQTLDADEIIQLQAQPEWTSAQFIENLCEKGILYQFGADFHLYKGNTQLAPDQLLSEIPLQTHDLLRVISAKSANQNQQAQATAQTSASADQQALLNTIDALKTEVSELKKMLTEALSTPSTQQTHPSESLDRWIEKLSKL